MVTYSSVPCHAPCWQHACQLIPSPRRTPTPRHRVTLRAATCSLLEVSCVAWKPCWRAHQEFLHLKGGLQSISPPKMFHLAFIWFQASMSLHIPCRPPLLLLVSKTGQSRNLICSKAQYERATSEQSSSAYVSWAVHPTDRYRPALLPGLERGGSGKGCGSRWVNTRAILQIPTASRSEE